MRHIRILLVTALVLASVEARASDSEATTSSTPPDAAVVSPPSVAAPREAPPTPPDPVPPPSEQPPPGAHPNAAPPGGWVYTQQYGWVWMPYGDAYWYVPPNGYGQPYQYIYYPTGGWVWVAAPWIWGIGPWPWFGVVRPARFGWYAFGWWRVPWRWHRPVPFRGVVVVHGRAHRHLAR
jgi:hypothetical protein